MGTPSPMPWNHTHPLMERTKLMLEWRRRWELHEGHANVSDPAREY